MLSIMMGVKEFFFYPDISIICPECCSTDIVKVTKRYCLKFMFAEDKELLLEYQKCNGCEVQGEFSSTPSSDLIKIEMEKSRIECHNNLLRILEKDLTLIERTYGLDLGSLSRYSRQNIAILNMFAVEIGISWEKIMNKFGI